MGVKRWPAERFAQVTKKIHEKTGLPLLVCGTKHDEPTILEFLKYLPDLPVVNIIGQTSIMEFIEVIGRAKLVLTNDTSAYHIGVAQQVDTVLVCGGYTYDRYAHYQYANEGYKDPVLVTEDMECFNCDNHCIYNNKEIFPCIGNITVDKVWNAVEKVIDEGDY
jgi:ADP-heptose:LPS heptosyltransferase